MTCPNCDMSASGEHHPMCPIKTVKTEVVKIERIVKADGTVYYRVDFEGWGELPFATLAEALADVADKTATVEAFRRTAERQDELEAMYIRSLQCRNNSQ
jgi:hypothetical protein